MREQASTHTASDTGAAPSWVVERPRSELARGKYAWPAWGIGLLGGFGIALGIAFLVWRWRKRRLKNRLLDRPPEDRR
ncbi:MAG TPA: hypothetical protein VGJ84_22565 [Polyangiaceae bacterium]|jgi:hypothetical protein